MPTKRGHENVAEKLWVDFPETKGCSSVRRAFLERLATYDVVTWSGKTGLSPPFLARHGWRRVQPDVVECVFCRQLLSVKLPSPVCQKQYEEAAAKLKARLVDGHSRYCVYLTEPTPERVLHLEPLSPAELRRDVADAAAAFPDADADRVPLHFDRADQVAELWRRQRPSDTRGRLETFTLALIGWRWQGDSTVQCRYCNRRWLLEHSTQPVDPVNQHQPWCAWRHPTRGWRWRLDLLRSADGDGDDDVGDDVEGSKKTRLRTPDQRSVAEGMRAVRRMLDGTVDESS